MPTEYCAAISIGSDNFQRVRAKSWWDAALEFAGKSEDVSYHAKENAMRRIGPGCGIRDWRDVADSDVIDVDSDKVFVAVAIARRVLPPSELIGSEAEDAQMIIDAITDNHDDYLCEAAEDYKARKNPKNHPDLNAALRELAAGIADALAKFERSGYGPHWFIFEDAQSAPIGFFRACADIAAKIDAADRLDRHPECQSYWIERQPEEDIQAGKACEPRRYDLWQAAELLGLAAPDKPNGWEL